VSIEIYKFQSTLTLLVLVTLLVPAMAMPASAAERKVSPANTPSPPEYVGIADSSAISMEKQDIEMSLFICG